jgi:type 1 fimbriae regulatory protein FimB/type 1 fimbriae regulatory protein FimE
VGTVPPRWAPYKERRDREYLTPKEVERLIAAARARGRRYGLRDATMILVAFRHGLRVSELCALRLDQIDFQNGKLHVRRLKNGMPSVHLMGGEELRALRALKRDDAAGRFVFMTERGAPMTRHGFGKLVARLSEVAKFQFGVHPHMLRPRHRLQARERRARHAIAAALPGAQKHHAHGTVYGSVAGAFQELLGGLTERRRGRKVA